MRCGVMISVVLVTVACSTQQHVARRAPQHTTTIERAARSAEFAPAQRILHLPPIRRGPLPGYLLIADRDNNRALVVSPTKHVVWQATNLRGPDDAFFTPGYRTIVTNEEFNDTLTEIAVRTRRAIWRYGHDAAPGSGAGYLDSPDDAYQLANGTTTVADIRNCRIVLLSHAKRVLRVLGGSCVHDPPRGFASPNGDTPLPRGGLLVTEIGGWIDRLDAHGNLVWSIRSPVSYPSDAQLLPNGRILVAGFTVPGKIVELTRAGRVTWSFGATSGPAELAKPSLAVRLPNGMIAANDDWNHRVIVIDPRTKRIVWQYGHTGVAGSSSGYLNKPDGLDLLPSATASGKAQSSAPRPARARRTEIPVRRIGSLPRAVSRLAAVGLPDGRVVALGGLVGGRSSSEVLVGPPERLADAGRLPIPTHDAAAAFLRGAVYLYGGGQAVSSPAVLRVNPKTGRASAAGRLVEPLSDLGAAVVDRRTYLVGGYTGARYATAVLRMRGPHMSVVARLPHGLRYGGVAAIGKTIYVAGGVTASGETAAIDAVDLRTGRVRRIGSLPLPLAHAPLVAAGAALYLIGGRTAAGTASARILRIDPRTGATVVAGRLPQPLSDAAAVTLGSRVIVLGGAATTATSSVYAFRP